MERLYRFLKALILVLLLCIAAVGLRQFMQSNGAENTAAAGDTTEGASPAPDFTVYDIDGNPHSLSDFRGKPVVLNFWASWCGPCKSEMPDLEAAYQTYGDRIHFLMVALTDGTNETVESASGYIALQGYTFPVYYDTEMDGAVAYSVSGIPVTYFIDENGCFVAYYQSAMSAQILQKGIDLLLGVQ